MKAGTVSVPAHGRLSQQPDDIFSYGRKQPNFRNGRTGRGAGLPCDHLPAPVQHIPDDPPDDARCSYRSFTGGFDGAVCFSHVCPAAAFDLRRQLSGSRSPVCQDARQSLQLLDYSAARYRCDSGPFPAWNGPVVCRGNRLVRGDRHRQGAFRRCRHEPFQPCDGGPGVCDDRLCQCPGGFRL